MNKGRRYREVRKKISVGLFACQKSDPHSTVISTEKAGRVGEYSFYNTFKDQH